MYKKNKEDQTLPDEWKKSLPLLACQGKKAYKPLWRSWSRRYDSVAYRLRGKAIGQKRHRAPRLLPNGNRGRGQPARRDAPRNRQAAQRITFADCKAAQCKIAADRKAADRGGKPDCHTAPRDPSNGQSAKRQQPHGQAAKG